MLQVNPSDGVWYVSSAGIPLGSFNPENNSVRAGGNFGTVRDWAAAESVFLAVLMGAQAAPGVVTPHPKPLTTTRPVFGSSRKRAKRKAA